MLAALVTFEFAITVTNAITLLFHLLISNNGLNVVNRDFELAGAKVEQMTFAAFIFEGLQVLRSIFLFFIETSTQNVSEILAKVFWRLSVSILISL